MALQLIFSSLKEVFIQESRNVHKALSNKRVKVLIYAWSKQHIELLYTCSIVITQHFFKTAVSQMSLYFFFSPKENIT